MSEPRLTESALTEAEIDQILRTCDGRALLIGGQALAFWAQYYGITPEGVLAPNVTRDVDFLGTAEVALELAEALRSEGWRYWQPSVDDATSQTAKLSKRVAGQRVKQVDFLGSIIGLDTERARRRGVTLHWAGGARVKVLHPVDVLESRLKNLAALPTKRDRRGIAQAQLAIDVLRSHLRERVREGSVRPLLKVIEEVGRMAQDKRLEAICHRFKLDPLAAVPADEVPHEDFRTRRWPQILELVSRRRRAYARRHQRAEREP